MNAKTLAMLLAVALVAGFGGWFAAGLRTADSDGTSRGEPADGPCPGGAQPLHWKAPMDPTYVRDEPGKSPMGMDLVPECPDGGDAGEEGSVQINPTVQQNMGIRTASAERRDLTRQVRAVGRVAYDERLISHVHTKIQGWIEKLHVEYEGQTVRKGQPMLEIYSPELVSTQEELLVAAKYRDSMSESTFPDLQEGGAALLDATRRRLELWDIPDRDIERLLETGEIKKTLTLYAPSRGVVTHLMARQGMEVNPNDNLYTIADLSRVWIYADLYEYEIPWVEKGQSASVSFRGVAGPPLAATVDYVYPSLDPKTRTARVRLELPNPGLVLKPDMYADVVLETQTRPGVVSVPDEAVLRSGRRDLVIVSLGDGSFAPREVQLGLESGDGWVEVQSGVAAGDVVVTSGQFLINSESSLKEAIQKRMEGRNAETPDRREMDHGDHPMPAPKPIESADDPHRGHSMDDHRMHGSHTADPGADEAASDSRMQDPASSSTTSQE